MLIGAKRFDRFGRIKSGLNPGFKRPTHEPIKLARHRFVLRCVRAYNNGAMDQLKLGDATDHKVYAHLHEYRDAVKKGVTDPSGTSGEEYYGW
jgi:hypothetical protein